MRQREACGALRGVFTEVQLKQIGHPEVIGECIVVSQQRATLGHREVIMILVSQVISVYIEKIQSSQKRVQLLSNVYWARCVRVVREARGKGAYYGCNSLPCSDQSAQPCTPAPAPPSLPLGAR